jgi:hypothetical protein
MFSGIRIAPGLCNHHLFALPKGTWSCAVLCLFWQCKQMLITKRNGMMISKQKRNENKK